jgi:hypothetical protein
MVEVPLIRFVISMEVINGKDRICSTTNTHHTSRIATTQTRLSHIITEQQRNHIAPSLGSKALRECKWNTHEG